MINSCMNSETILSANTHPGDSTTETVTGEKFKGDGYYGRSDGLHSVQYTYSGLTGDIIYKVHLQLILVKMIGLMFTHIPLHKKHQVQLQVLQATMFGLEHK